MSIKPENSKALHIHILYKNNITLAKMCEVEKRLKYSLS